MLKRMVLIAMVMSIPLIGFAQVTRLITVDTPYIDDKNLLKISLVSYKPLDVQLNLTGMKWLQFSVDTVIPFWFCNMPNFGAKVSLNFPLLRFTAFSALKWLRFNGEDELINMINNNKNSPVTVKTATLNFYSLKFDIGAGLDLFLLQTYLVLDFQFSGNKAAKTAHIHPVLGGNIQLGPVALFAEIGYFIPTTKDTLKRDLEGLLATKRASDLDIGLGAEIDLIFFNLRAGFLFPGVEIKYGPKPEDSINLPILPYADISIQF